MLPVVRGADSIPRLRSVRALYTVREACRLLGPDVTPRKIHYWLHTGLLGEPARPEGRGRPCLLTFEQVLKVAVLQRLRGDLRFSLQRVRRALTWLLDALVADEWAELEFFRTGVGEIGVRDRHGQVYAVGGQGVIPDTLPELLTDFVRDVRRQWEEGVVPARGFRSIVSNVSVMGGAPTIRDTRIETAFVAHLATESGLDELAALFPHVPSEALVEALEFEGIAA